MRALFLAVLVGCSEPVAPLELDAETQVRTWVDDVGPAGGTLTAQVVGPFAVVVVLGEPSANGLDFETEEAPRIERAGEQSITTVSWTFTGDKGNYQIDGPQASWGADGLAVPSPLFVDLGVEAPREGELVDIVSPSAVAPFPMAIVLTIAGLGLLLIGGVAFAFKPRRTPPPAPPLPPDVAAMRAWEAARADASLDDHGRALAISAIFRTYLEDVLAFPATAWTTSEILAHLQGLKHVTDKNLPRAKALLRATDRVKFADEDAAEDLFDALGHNLEAFVEYTRARRLGGSQIGGPRG